MRSEILTQRPDIVIRQLMLEPGDAMPWHTDACHRFSVVVRGDRLTIEFRDSGERVEVAVHPGMTGWDAPDARVHRGVNSGVNSGASTYEEVVTFFLDTQELEPQPEHR